MWHWGISVKTMLSVRSFHRRGFFVSWGGKKKARSRRPHALATTQQEPLRRREVSATKKRGAEMIWNKRRTLFIQVRIDLVARLIITLTPKSEGEISWCYRSNPTSLVKRLHTTTYFVNFFWATIRSIRSERVLILKSRKIPVTE